jgi:hypothetical protein
MIMNAELKDIAFSVEAVHHPLIIDPRDLVKLTTSSVAQASPPACLDQSFAGVTSQ